MCKNDTLILVLEDMYRVFSGRKITVDSTIYLGFIVNYRMHWFWRLNEWKRSIDSTRRLRIIQTQLNHKVVKATDLIKS